MTFGPFNKVAYTFGVATVSAGVYTYAGPMAVTMTAPPLGCALAAFLAKKKFTQEEREAAKSAVAMGCVGITEELFRLRPMTRCVLFHQP